MCFVSGNPHKIAECAEILQTVNVEVVPYKYSIEELQTTDEEKLVRDKVLKAFDRLKRPLFVEHTGLHLSALNGFPAGLTQVFWNTLEAERVASLFGRDDSDHAATARTTIGYCDGRVVRFFAAKIDGRIVGVPRGDSTFQWDCVFQPAGYDETFAEMGAKKHLISMRRKALEKFAGFLAAGG